MMKINREDAQAAAYVYDLTETLAIIDAVMVFEKDGIFAIAAMEEKPAYGEQLAEMYSAFHTLSHYLKSCGCRTEITDEEDTVVPNAYGLSELDVSELIGPVKRVDEADFGTVYTAIDRGERDET